MEQAKPRKEVAHAVLEVATSTLHKWSSNVPQLEVENSQETVQLSLEQTYAKSQLKVKSARVESAWSQIGQAKRHIESIASERGRNDNEKKVSCTN